MHFTYDDRHCERELMQGDVLARTSELNALLRDVHPHYAQHEKNLFFLVLTQSCDLVPREGGRCKAQYISIAPVRSLDLVVERYLAQQPSLRVRSELPVMGAKFKGKATEFLQRLLNNNEQEFFYLESAETALGGDCVAFLRLSIAIKADLHYATCAAAKILQLNSTFQAKLGWLVGQMYSRVGTDDWDKADAGKKIAEILSGAAIWVDDAKVGAVEEEYKKLSAASPDAKMSVQDISRVASSAPSKKQKVIAEAMRVIESVLGESEAETAEKLRRRLSGDGAISQLLK